MVFSREGVIENAFKTNNNKTKMQGLERDTTLKRGNLDGLIFIFMRQNVFFLRQNLLCSLKTYFLTPTRRRNNEPPPQKPPPATDRNMPHESHLRVHGTTIRPQSYNGDVRSRFAPARKHKPYHTIPYCIVPGKTHHQKFYNFTSSVKSSPQRPPPPTYDEN